MPVFEAVVNSFQGIEDLLPGAANSTYISITVERDPQLPETWEGDVNGFVIVDNGVGFTDVNFEAFMTSDTQNKAARGGKGLGHYMWLKAFDYAEVESHFFKDDVLVKRAFKFALTGGDHRATQLIEPGIEYLILPRYR